MAARSVACGEEDWMKELEVQWSEKLPGAQAMLWVQPIGPRCSELPAGSKQQF